MVSPVVPQSNNNNTAVSTRSSVSAPSTVRTRSSFSIRGNLEGVVRVNNPAQTSLRSLSADYSSSSSGLSIRDLSITIPTTPTSSSPLSAARSSSRLSSSSSSDSISSLRSPNLDSDEPLSSTRTSRSSSSSSRSSFSDLSSPSLTRRSSDESSSSTASLTSRSSRSSRSSGSDSNVPLLACINEESSSSTAVDVPSRSSASNEWDTFVSSNGNVCPPSWESFAMISVPETLTFSSDHLTVRLTPVEPQDLPLSTDFAQMLFTELSNPLISNDLCVARELRSISQEERRFLNIERKILKIIREYQLSDIDISIPNQISVPMFWTENARNQRVLEVAGLRRYVAQHPIFQQAEDVRRIIEIMRTLQRGIHTKSESVKYIQVHAHKILETKKDVDNWPIQIKRMLEDAPPCLTRVQLAVYKALQELDVSNKFTTENASEQVKNITELCADIVEEEDAELAKDMAKLAAQKGKKVVVSLIPRKSIKAVLTDLDVQRYITFTEGQLDTYLASNAVSNGPRLLQRIMDLVVKEFTTKKQVRFSLSELKSCLDRVTPPDQNSQQFKKTILDDWCIKALCGAFVAGRMVELMSEEVREQCESDYQRKVLAPLLKDIAFKLGQCVVDAECDSRGRTRIRFFDNYSQVL